MNNILKYSLFGLIIFSLLYCAGPYKGEIWHYNNSSKTSIQAGDEWQTLESSWKFYEDAEFIITNSDNSSAKGLWFVHDSKLEIILGGETITYSIHEIDSDKLLLLSGTNEITLVR